MAYSMIFNVTLNLSSAQSVILPKICLGDIMAETSEQVQYICNLHTRFLSRDYAYTYALNTFCYNKENILHSENDSGTQVFRCTL